MATKVTSVAFPKLNTLTREWRNILCNEIIRRADKYVPFDTGALKNSAHVYGDAEGIQYDGAYARYQWYGKVMVDPITGKGAFYSEEYGFWSRPNTQKVLSSRDMVYGNNPSGLRGSYWVNRMWADEGDEICNAFSKGKII